MARDNRGGLTLIELLVVMAIIGILAALLFPSLTNAKAKALQIQCTNNLHQQGVALHTFLTEYHSYPLWVAPTNSEVPGRWWADQLERVGFGVSNPSTNFDHKGVWRCPSAKPRHEYDMYYGYNVFGVLMVGDVTNNFGLGGQFTENSATRVPIGESEVVAPSEMIAVGDSDYLAFMRNVGYDFFDGHLRHQDKANVLFCDGHVESLTREGLFEDTSDAALARWNRDHLPHRDRL
jgi:prepilin-type processing-associated H-X9-DG protein/prepilin-type N-terminal cleavage/methylation domain-containing protein